MDFAMFNKIATDSCSEDGVAARFYDRVVKTGEIDANGLPKFRLTCFCEIRIKDNTSEVYDQPATAEILLGQLMAVAHYPPRLLVFVHPARPPGDEQSL